MSFSVNKSQSPVKIGRFSALRLSQSSQTGEKLPVKKITATKFHSKKSSFASNNGIGNTN